LKSKSKLKSRLHKKLFEELENEFEFSDAPPKKEINLMKEKNDSKSDIKSDSKKESKSGSKSDSKSEGKNNKDSGDSDDKDEKAPAPGSKKNQPKDDKDFEMPKDERAPTAKKKMKELTFDMEMTKVSLGLHDWLSISSGSFANTQKYPGIGGSFIHLTKKFTRINDKFVSPFETNGVPSPTSLYFKQNGKYIYYFETESCPNALGRIYIDEVQDVRDLPSDYGCFSVIEKDIKISYKICAETNFIKTKWLCKLQEICQVEKSKVCGGVKDQDSSNPKHKTENRIQPMILIPLAAPSCNEDWDYLKNGADWECKCKEGDNQSPVDLPPVRMAISTPASPIFEYVEVPNEAEDDYRGDLVKKGRKHRIIFKDGALRIFAESFGKIVTLDGAGYYADEIVFHTPSEHKIGGKRLDMEMKIIHRAKTVGDFGKMLTLSFLFKTKAGSYNKFLDKLDFYNLPNPLETFMELRGDLFIPDIFLDEDIDGSGEMQPFSFYSYEGSTTEPPCNENTLVYVASEPIKMGVSTLELFREALKKPDQMDPNGRIINTSKNQSMTNRRKVQPLKGRAVFHYDKKNDCEGGFHHIEDHKFRKGHYERVTKKAQQYYYVDGEKPSMMPGAYVVTDDEARGKMDSKTREMQEKESESEDESENDNSSNSNNNNSNNNNDQE